MDNRILNFLVGNSTRLYIGWVITIALLTLLPGRSIPDFNWNFLALDKWIHFGIFSILSWLGILSFKQQSSWVAKYAIHLSVLIAIAYGTLLEFGQGLVPDRMFDYNDLVANCGGSIFGYAIYLVQIKLIR